MTIISVGFLNNLYDLLKDPKGYALVEKKVKLLVAMGGLNNDGFNFVRHGLVDQTQYVIENWPGTLVTTHVGGSMITGQTLTATTPVNNPVRRAYELWCGPNKGRSSWDQVSVLYAVYGTQWFNETWAGGGSLRNRYTWTFKKGYRGYAAPKDDSQVKDEIERLMTLPPKVQASEIPTTATSIKVLNEDLFIGVAEDSTHNAAPMIVEPARTTDSQQWVFDPQSDGAHAIRNVRSDLLVDVWSISQDEGAVVNQGVSYGPASNQKFEVINVGGAWHFRAQHSNLYLAVDNNRIVQSTTAGTFTFGYRPPSAPPYSDAHTGN